LTIFVAESTVKLAYFYSVSERDPDSTRPVDPDSESGSESRRAKMTHKNIKKVKKCHVLKCWIISFEG
jgi:hypothetical protein